MAARFTLAAHAVALVGVLAACGYSGATPARPAGQQIDVADSRAADPSAALPAPGRLVGETRRADLLVVARRTIPSRLRVSLEGLDTVRDSDLLAVASVPVGERAITVAAIDPSTYRQFTPRSTARAAAVWRSIAAGELAVTHEIGRSLGRPLGGRMALRAGKAEVPLRIGAYAMTVPRVDAVVNYKRGEQLGMTPDNALLVSVRGDDVAGTAAEVEKLVGKSAAVVRLVDTVPTGGSSQQLAYLTGGAVAQAVGSFRYQYFADGTVRPDDAWVAANLRTENVPILGRVTCHRVMLPQLRAALAEIEAQGLADTINVGDYGGCYAPRFIGRDPANGLSLHTWGIAVDLNVAENQRGTVGEIDRRVVAIFKKWGFAWGGDWSWTDPMHFELAALVR